MKDKEEVKNMAEHLIKKFLKISPELKENAHDGFKAKECAMLLVDYAILEGDAWITPSSLRSERHKFWFAVKDELREL